MTRPASPAPLSWLACPACGRRVEELAPVIRCPYCHGLLDLQHEPPPLRGKRLAELFDARLSLPPSGPTAQQPVCPTSGVWRFAELVLPGAERPVSYPEGNTPLLSRSRIAEWAGIPELLLKHEGLNPTGSFKDRGMTVGITQAMRLGIRTVGCASTGNTSASLAAYAAQAGLQACVLVPAGRVATGKLAQAVGFGALVLAVRGDFDACLALVEQAREELDLYLLNSINPFRLAGQKTIVFELLQQRNWDPPDWIILPGGNLGNTAAFGAALAEARALGLIDRLPRLAVVQAEGAAPFAKSFAGGFEKQYRFEAETVATAIRIGNPASWTRAVQAIRTTNGVVASVSDRAILEAKSVIDRAGVGCEPASAASLAGARKLVETGTIPATAAVVAVLTGHMLKDPEILLEDHRVLEIEPTLSALAAALRR